MRKSSLDELPQLAKVVKGDINLARLRPRAIAQPGHATMSKFTGRNAPE